jgi:hypothetical protein
MIKNLVIIGLIALNLFAIRQYKQLDARYEHLDKDDMQCSALLDWSDDLLKECHKKECTHEKSSSLNEHVLVDVRNGR